MWGASASGACPPLLLDGCPARSQQPVPTSHSAWPPRSALPSVQWGAGWWGCRAAEKGGDCGDGGGRNAWVGTPGCRRPPLSLGAPPETLFSSYLAPPGSFSSPGYCARCRHRVSAGAHPQTLLPSLYVTSHLGSQCQCHFSKRLTLTTGWSPRVTPTVATPRVPESFLSHPHPNGCLFHGFDLYPLCS